MKLREIEVGRDYNVWVPRLLDVVSIRVTRTEKHFVGGQRLRGYVDGIIIHAGYTPDGAEITRLRGVDVIGVEVVGIVARDVIEPCKS